MSNVKKVTKRENFGEIAEILTGLGRADLAEVMNHEIELLNKKRAKSGLTANQKANEEIKVMILDTMREIGKPVTITDLINANEELATVTNSSNQKVSALMTQLKNSKTVVRGQEGKKAVFSIADWF